MRDYCTTATPADALKHCTSLYLTACEHIVGVESKVRISKMLIFQEKQKTSAYLQF